MPVLAQALAIVAALSHVVFFYMETIAFTRPSVHPRFGVKAAEHVEVVRPIMVNQGFYNLFLAVGVLVGVGLSNADGTAGTAGTAAAVFGLSCMALAGVLLAASSPRLRRAAAVQAGLPILAIALVALL